MPRQKDEFVLQQMVLADAIGGGGACVNVAWVNVSAKRVITSTADAIKYAQENEQAGESYQVVVVRKVFSLEEPTGKVVRLLRGPQGRLEPEDPHKDDPKLFEEEMDKGIADIEESDGDEHSA